MKSTKELPEHYAQILSVDLSKNKRQAVLVNALAIVIAAAMVVPVLIFRGFDEPSVTGLFIAAAATLGGIIAYIILHELTHGVFMLAFGEGRPKFGFTGLYAYARADRYFGKAPYLVIALAPVFIWGAVLAVLCVILPSSWFWAVYIIQVMNISGAAGDLYVTARFLFLPKDILVYDTGTAMTVYSKQK